MDPLECVFGPGDGILEPWHAYHKCQCKEVNQATCDFLHATAGLEGSYHDGYGWVIEMDLWSAFLQYIHWCQEHQIDFKFHMSQVLAGDVYYTKLAATKLTEFGG